MKKIALLTLLFVIVLCAVACAAVTYKDDVATSDIAAAVDKKISNSDVLVTADELYFDYFNKEYASLVAEYTIKYSASGSLFDEYGIFKVADAADTDKIVTMIEEFKQYRIDADMGYLPLELPKIKDAKIKVVGNYVMYTFLSDADSTAAFSELEAMLTK